MDPQPNNAQDAAYRAARQRHFIIGLFRLSGALVVAFGFAIMLNKFAFVSGRKAEIMGAIIASVGMVQFILVPHLMIRAFATIQEKAGDGE